MWAPKIDQTQALETELGYFLACLRNNKTPFNDGVAGLRVVKMLEAADKCVSKRGELVSL